jgi:hypothetical protein
MAVEAGHLVSVGRLHRPQQGLEMEPVRQHDQIPDRPLEPGHLERIGRREDGQPVPLVGPEGLVIAQRMEPFEQRTGLAPPVFLAITPSRRRTPSLTIAHLPKSPHQARSCFASNSFKGDRNDAMTHSVCPRQGLDTSLSIPECSRLKLHLDDRPLRRA